MREQSTREGVQEKPTGGRERNENMLMASSEADSWAQIEGRWTRRTTFEEYMRSCYTLLSKRLHIKTDKDRDSRYAVLH
jgi:hypothetical protein